MAPRLPLFQPELIRDMISSESLTTSQTAKVGGCSKRSIITIRTDLGLFGDGRGFPV
jgi:hypothetical protein